MNFFILAACITGVISSVICMILIPLIIRGSERMGLMDAPNERKVHMKPIPRLGGIAIFVSALFGVLVSGLGFQALATLPVLFGSVLVLFFVGLWDDLKNISAKLRFVLQICCALALANAGVRLTSLFGIFGIHELNIYAQYFLTVLIIVGVTNSFNLIDGIDGLAASLALTGMLVMACLSFALKFYPLLIVFISFGGSLLGFLKFNRSPAKIFMGDAGSLVLGYLLGTSGIILIERAHHFPEMVRPEQAAILVTAVLIIPVFDTVRVFASRMRKGFSPFKADRTHIHHLFLVAGLNHYRTTFILCSFEVALIGIAILMPYTTSISIVFLFMVLLFHFATVFLRINQAMEDWLRIVKKMEMGVNDSNPLL